MGHGSYSVDTTAAKVAYQQAQGINPFAYSQTQSQVPFDQRTAHPSLSPYGVDLRESRDSADHPNSVAIACLFDETASMGDGPRVLQTKLPELFGTLLRRGFVEDPQIMMGAIGDAHNGEAAPLQVGQFESDNRIDENLENIYLELSGGGNGGETYGLGLYFLARHTAADCWDKRSKKGYVFLTGDENPHRNITRTEVKKYIGDTIETDLTIEQVLAEVQERYEVFFLHVGNRQAQYQNSLQTWRDLLGDNVISLESLDTICETIALTIGLMEGTLDSLDAGANSMVLEGANRQAVASASRSLVKLAGRTGTVAPATNTTLPPTTTDGNRTRRL